MTTGTAGRIVRLLSVSFDRVDSGTIGRRRLPVVIRDERRPVWVRAIVGPSSQRRAPLYMAHVFVGPQPPGWAETTWRYESCTFLAARTTPKRLVSALDSGELDLGSTCATFAFDPGDVWQWRRKPSFARLDRFGIAWPSTSFELSLEGLEYRQLPERLVGRDSPSFPTSGAAFDAFFYGNFVATRTMNPMLGRIGLRVIDTGARLRRVEVRPGGLDVAVGGSRVKGAVLELNSPTYRHRARLAGAGKVSWPLPSGAMDDAWLWLKRGANWLDYRAPRSWGGHSAPDDKLTLPAPEDLVAEITALASQAEGQHLEYKRSLPPAGGAKSRAERKAKRAALKDIVAFANGGGGTVLYHVTDEGEIVGVDGPAGKARDRLSEFVRSRVSPSPPHHISPEDLDGKLVLVLEVEPNQRTLYSLLIDANRPEYYIRRDGTTYPAGADEICDGRGVVACVPTPAGRQPPKPGTPHEHRDGLAGDRDVTPQARLGMNPRRSAGAARGGVDLPGEIREPGVADLARRGRAAEVGVVAGARHLQQSTGRLHREVLARHRRDHLEAPFGGTASRRSSAARRATASSDSSWTMRRRAATSSALSVLVVPGRRPASISSWRRNLAYGH